MTNSVVALPPGWAWTSLEEVAELKGGLTLGKKREPHEHVRPVPYLRVANVQRGFLSLNEVKTIAATEAEIEELCLRDGDILFNEGGDRDKLGRGWVWSGELPECIHQNHVFRARLRTPEIVPKLVSMYANWFGQAYFRGHGKQTTNLASINLKTLSKFPFPLPPGNEQRRIVAKLEALQAHSRRAKDSLDAIPALLERFRQSVLAAAFRGDLTRDWRKANPDVESASKLLERIRAERRRRWEEAELNRMQSKGKLPKDDRWKEKYEEAPLTDTRGLGKLPAGWCWASLEQLTINFDGERVPVKRQDRAERTGTFPYYGASGVIDQVDDYLFDGHFLLIAEDGANLLSRSTPIAFEATGKFWVNNHAHVVQVPGELVPLTYLGSYLNGFDLNPFTTGTAQPKLTQKNMNRIPVPLAPQAEQAAITTILRNVRRCELLINDALARARTRSEVLEAALLGSAFRGELVPQGPNDEPASVLLERIRAERERPKEVNSTSHSKRSRETKVA
ncbi:restriction endonuclease subunit S [Myxococcus sp. AB056]|uniref:restriction endonuclease subunit S n=1 Tax=Myxococcus sp. AB056 TaxID=2562792 RepID=UPI001146375E|nr:restriction endonuclease subunit S [Myxococcus sp. AB056]